jgi:uncharacterized protein YmfQ (DUF2313 family)
MAGTEKRRSTEQRNTDTMSVAATAGSTFEWREEGAQVRGNDVLECEIRRILPAHIQAIFTYS